MRRALAILGCALALAGCNAPPSPERPAEATSGTAVALPATAPAVPTVAPPAASPAIVISPVPAGSAAPAATLGLPATPPPPPTPHPRPPASPSPSAAAPSPTAALIVERNLGSTGEAGVVVTQAALIYGRRSLALIGELENRGDAPAEAISISVPLMNAAGEVITQGQLAYGLTVLRPGESTPFSVSFGDKAPAQPRVGTLQVHATQGPGPGSQAVSHDLEVVQPRVEIQPATADTAVIAAIAGEVRNTAERPVRGLTVIAAVYDAEGQILAVREARTGVPQLNPGASTSFRATVVGMDRIEQFKVVAGARWAD